MSHIYLWFGDVPLRGTIWQNDVPLASGLTRGGPQDDRLGALVQIGPVVVAIQSQRGATGVYDLEVTFVRGVLEIPKAGSFQSGIGLLSGWVCEADGVELVIDGANGTQRPEAAYGTDQADKAETEEGAEICGARDNGFGLLFNWNLLLINAAPLRDSGVFTVRALADGVEFGWVTFTVTTLGEKFLEDVTGETVVEGCPTPGETVCLKWQENSQNFVVTDMQ